MTEESDDFAETGGYKTLTNYASGNFNLRDPTMEEVEMVTWHLASI